MAIDWWLDFENGPLVSDDYTQGSDDFPTSGIVVTGNGFIPPTLVTPSDTDWETGEDAYNTGAHWSAYGSISSPPTMSLQEFHMKICFEISAFSGSGITVFKLLNSTGPCFFDIQERSLTGIDSLRCVFAWNNSNSIIEIDLNDGGSSISSNQAYVLEVKFDVTDATTATKAQARLYQKGATPPAFSSATASFNPTNTSTSNLIVDSIILGDTSGSGDGWKFVKILRDNDFASDLDGAEDTVGYSNWGTPPAGSNIVSLIQQQHELMGGL